jgi:minor histocompatibility antigen H13
MAESDLLSSSTLQENVTETASGRTPASLEGAAVAYGSLVVMALLPIFFGAFRSVKHHKEQKVRRGTPYGPVIISDRCFVLLINKYFFLQK